VLHGEATVIARENIRQVSDAGPALIPESWKAAGQVARIGNRAKMCP